MGQAQCYVFYVDVISFEEIKHVERKPQIYGEVLFKFNYWYSGNPQL